MPALDATAAVSAEQSWKPTHNWAAVLGWLIGVLLSGLILGALARFAVPGKDPLAIWQTILLGIAGSLVGGIVAALVGVVDNDELIEPGEAAASFLFSLGGAIVLLILYRKYVQKRPITGPDV
jgi:uncharacterized membrane protein YeaQ/YmgE (transglycosylase-associated protein family)